MYLCLYHVSAVDYYNWFCAGDRLRCFLAFDVKHYKALSCQVSNGGNPPFHPLNLVENPVSGKESPTSEIS